MMSPHTAPEFSNVIRVAKFHQALQRVQGPVLDQPVASCPNVIILPVVRIERHPGYDDGAPGVRRPRRRTR